MPVQTRFLRLFREVCTIDISVRQLLEMPGRNLGELQPNILTKIQRVESEYLRVPVSRIAMEPALGGVRHGPHSPLAGCMYLRPSFTVEDSPGNVFEWQRAACEMPQVHLVSQRNTLLWQDPSGRVPLVRLRGT